MTNLRVLVLFLSSIMLQFSNALQQPPSCGKFSFEGIKSTKSVVSSFKTCVDLPVLDSYLHWNYYPETSTLEIAYRHAGVPPSSSKWVAWAINPTSKGMVGSQALVAFHKPDGTVSAHTSPVKSYGTELAPGELSFNVSGLSAVSANNAVIIFATITVPNNATVLNQVWQDGPLAKDGTPTIHSTSEPNLNSKASLDLLSGTATATAATSSGFSLRNIHGILNGMSWGVMMPIGAIIARYKTIFSDPTWFYLHVSFQFSGYIFGVAGWATGMKLGNDSVGITHYTHRNIGITLFIFGTLQALALLLRPMKDHKYRIYWNMYHHSIGYSTITLSIVNIIKGLEILNPSQVWKNAYIGLITVLAMIAVGLEAFTWYGVSQKKKTSELTDESVKPSGA